MLKEIETDILVIGGGIAGAFAAYKARAAGARVLLVDRSYFGRSGCSALASGVYPSYMPGDKVEDWINGLGAGPLVNQALLREVASRDVRTPDDDGPLGGEVA